MALACLVFNEKLKEQPTYTRNDREFIIVKHMFKFIMVILLSFFQRDSNRGIKMCIRLLVVSVKLLTQ